MGFLSEIIVSLFQIRIILITVLLAFGLKYIFKILGRDSRLIQFSKKFNGPFALPVLGNSLNLMLGAKGTNLYFFIRSV